MTRKVFLILLALVLALSVGVVACGGATGQEEEEEEEKSGTCVDFEDLTLGTEYPFGDTIYTEGAVITVEHFQSYDIDRTWCDRAIPPYCGYARVESGTEAGGSGQEMWVTNVNLRFNFNGPCEGLSLLFYEDFQNVNVEINEDFVNVENFADLPPEIGGVDVSVVNGFGGDRGSLTLSGTIKQNSFAIGGEELFIDRVCLPSSFRGLYTLTIPPPLGPEVSLPCSGSWVTVPGSGTFIYEEGTVVDLVAEAEEGCRFIEWIGNVDTVANVTAAETTITMEGNYLIGPRFEQI